MIKIMSNIAKFTVRIVRLFMILIIFLFAARIPPVNTVGFVFNVILIFKMYVIMIHITIMQNTYILLAIVAILITVMIYTVINMIVFIMTYINIIINSMKKIMVINITYIMACNLINIKGERHPLYPSMPNFISFIAIASLVVMLKKRMNNLMINTIIG